MNQSTFLCTTASKSDQ